MEPDPTLFDDPAFDLRRDDNSEPEVFRDIDGGSPVIAIEAPPDQLTLDLGLSKPPYRVPTMVEVEGIEPNGYDVVSTFSGCGGSCLGFRMAGFRTVFASEFIPAAVETYVANHPTTPICVQDVRELEPDLILKTIGKERGDLDVLEGSPPCASFSMAGSREEHWGKEKKYSDTVQRVDDLFFEFVRLVDGLLPKVIVAENVTGLMIGNAVEYFNRIRTMLDKLGYVVWAKDLNAAWYGVPQNRRRIIIIGVRRDLNTLPVFPTRFPYGYSIRDALGDVATGLFQKTPFGEDGPRIASMDEPAPTVTVSGIGAKDRYSVGLLGDSKEEASIEGYAIGEEWKKLRPGQQSNRYFNLVKPDPDKPSPTITQTGGTLGAASVTHPTENRKFTIGELKRICAFPDDFILTGSWSQQWERLGRAVPPLMMFAVARTVRDGILRGTDQ